MSQHHRQGEEDLLPTRGASMMALDDSDDDEFFDVNDTDADMENATTTPTHHQPAAMPGSAAAASAAASSEGGNNDASEAEAEEEGETTTPLSQEVNAASEKRRAIQAIMRDKSLTDLERRLRIQQLMDGSKVNVDVNNGSSNGGIMGGISSAAAGIAGGISSLISGPNGGSGGVGGSSSLLSSGLRSNGQSAAGGDAEVVACVHYERKCNVVAPCCQRIFGCRVCHDEMSPHCGPMDRFAIKEIVCKDCGTRQDSKTNECISCKVTFAEYHCTKCNIWMNLQKRPFHCDECGFCRVGGRDNFKHCAKCCMCISVTVHATHNCMQDKYKNNCPVCREDMFSSRQSPQDLPCGHAIHAHCFRNLAGFDYRCPICKKTVVSRTSMSAAWRARARDIEMQPMPPDLARTVDIICNDCESKSTNRSWHFLGVQCPGCSSFNTVVENTVSVNSGGGVSNGSGNSRDGGGDGDENDTEDSEMGTS